MDLAVAVGAVLSLSESGVRLPLALLGDNPALAGLDKDPWIVREDAPGEDFCLLLATCALRMLCSWIADSNLPGFWSS